MEIMSVCKTFEIFIRSARWVAREDLPVEGAPKIMIIKGVLLR